MSTNLHSLKPGAVIAGYDIIRVLGAGGFGITYEGHSPVTDKRVAIKEFFPRGIASRDNTTKIVFDEKEAEVVAWALKRFESSTADQCRLKHPSIVEVHHYIKDNNTGYMIMEYVEGQTLEHWLKERKKLPSIDELRPLIDPVMDALDYLHRKKLVHRDIAPDNIMVKPDGKPMVIDFGALKLIEQQTQIRSMTNRSFMVSKQFYSPPEQVQEAGELDARADIYALGAVLYRALSGRPPANAEDRMQKIAFNKGDTYIRLADTQAKVQPEIAGAIDKALSFHAEKRPANISELRNGLGWGEDLPPTVLATSQARNAQKTTNTRVSASSVEQLKPPVKKRWVVPLGGVAVTAMILLLAFNPFGSQNTPSQAVITPKAETPAPSKVETPKASPLELARQDFESAQRINSKEAYEQFLKTHPEGLHATLARDAISKLVARDLTKLNIGLSTELKRVNCTDKVSDDWNAELQRAMRAFNARAKTNFDVSSASAEALKAVSERPVAFCAIKSCPAGQELVPAPLGEEFCRLLPATQTPPAAEKQAPNKETKTQAKGTNWCWDGYLTGYVNTRCFPSQADCLGARPKANMVCYQR